MKNNYFFTLLILLISFNSYCQQLSIEETFDYIENIENSYHGSTLNGDIVSVEYGLNAEGIFTQKTFYENDTRKKVMEIITVHVDDLVREWEYNGSYSISFKCKNNNCLFVQEDGERFINEKSKKYYSNNDLTVYVKQEYQAKKIIKALEYLFSIIDEKDFQRDKGDPFAAMVKSSNKPNQNSMVDLEENNGVYQLKARFGSIYENFILDSGASITTISKTVEDKLLNIGFIDRNSYLPNALFRIADGSIISLRRARLKSMAIGSFEVKNLIVSIGSENSPLLLGRNFLDKFKDWKIYNDEKKIELSK